MTALRHTAGPWVRDGHNLSTVLHCTAERGSPEARHITGDYEVIAECEGENWAANSLAIAALPDLIETLVEARAAFIVEYDDRGRVAAVSHGSDALRVLVAKLDAAIAACGGHQAMTAVEPLIPITAEIVDRDDRSVTIRMKAGHYARLSLAHVEITPAEDGRHIVEMPASIAEELGI